MHRRKREEVMTIHTNSILSNKDTLNKKQKRSLEILDVYRSRYHSLTDRAVMNILGYTDLNMVRPRITELIADGTLKEVDRVKDEVTKRWVRTVTIITREMQRSFL